ncbi:MAG: hypothetical protein ACYCZJ_13380 [Sulfuriferula sp.]
MSIENRTERKYTATRQIATVAKLMAMQLNPGIPAHKELLDALERALYRLRTELVK